MRGREESLRAQLSTANQRLREVESEHKRELREKVKMVDQLAVERRESVCVCVCWDCVWFSIMYMYNFI